jgi:hypothetical protein
MFGRLELSRIGRGELNLALVGVDAVGRARNGVVAVLVGVDADFLVGVDAVGPARNGVRAVLVGVDASVLVGVANWILSVTGNVWRPVVTNIAEDVDVR